MAGSDRERVEDRLPPGGAAGYRSDRRDDVDELRLAGDPDPVGMSEEADQEAADDDGVGDVVVVLDDRRRLAPVGTDPVVEAVLVPDVPLVE